MERLRILAAAVVLGEFTVPQLAVYAGASQDTVRSVLRRDAQFFSKEPTLLREGRPHRGRPAARYRVVEPTAIRAMVTDLEREVHTLRDGSQTQRSRGAVPEASGDAEFQDRLADVIVAEDALVRAWATDDVELRYVIVDTAMRSILQAHPNYDFATHASRDRLLSTSSEELALERRILNVHALTEITSEHEVIDTEQLRKIAWHISELYDIAPTERVTKLIHGLGQLAVKVHELPPLGLVTNSNQTPHDALQELDNRTWVREETGEGFESLWLQKWARPLSRRDMLLGLVVDDAGSIEELEATLKGDASADLPALVLSDRLDNDVVARVAAAGAVFVPRSGGIAALSWAIMGLAERMRGLPRLAYAPALSSAKPTRVSEAQIAVHWREEGYFKPTAKFVEQANANDPAILDHFTEDKFPGCFKEYAELLTWNEPWQTVLDTSNAPFWKWFEGGKLNASFNCVDRHAATDPDKTSIIWVPESESEEAVHISYAELNRQVMEFALVLRDFGGVKEGDRVTIHLPMVPELPIAMLACARLGAIHSAVSAGFSGQACATRIVNSSSHILITMDGYYQAGDLIDHKIKADEAVDLVAKEGLDVGKAEVQQSSRLATAYRTLCLTSADG